MSHTDRRLCLALFAVVGLILYLGLRPFDFARSNNVEWLKPTPGLQFDGTGLAISTRKFAWQSDEGPAPITVEMWVRAHQVSDAEPRAWLVLVDGSRLTPLGIRQEGADLVIWDAVTNPDGDRWYNDFRVPFAVRPGVLQHIAITSHEGAPTIYVGGIKAGTDAGYPIPLARMSEPFGGRLVIGAGPPWNASWSGEILGLAIHSRLLNADEIEQHSSVGPGARFAERATQSGAIAAYSFDEGAGSTVRDLATGAYDLWLPEYFRPPGRGLLQSVDPAERTALWNVGDAMLNVLGFAPLGLLISLLLRKRMKPIPIVLSATLVGFSISLGIEWTQSLMVTRSSSLQDLVLNTTGTLVGAVAPIINSRLAAGRNK